MTPKANRWQLPDGVDEILPPKAQQLESLRREILDLYAAWGYQLVQTPLIEFLESLHIVPSQELRLSTFTLVDQLSGRLMGVRTDLTSQVARIDAHVLQQSGTTRLCYADTVLRTRPNGPLGSRSPRLIGAELYGHKGIESDLEVISLLLYTLQIVGVEQPLLTLGHPHICRELLQAAALSPADTAELFEALQNKATADINRLLQRLGLPKPLSDALRVLPTLHGDTSVIAKARQSLATTTPALLAALAQLETVIAALRKRFPQQDLHVDLCELRGYDYHNGVTFSAYAHGHGAAIANGGRYDGIGAPFGRARPATGFDADLLTLLSLSKREFAQPELVYAPAGQDNGLEQAVAALRQEGKRVVQGFSGQAADPAALGCTHVLVPDGKGWKRVPLQLATAISF